MNSSPTKDLIGKIKKLASQHNTPLNLMEVCGTHTMAIAQAGIRNILPENIRLLSGPGCPVCVTAGEDIDLAVQLANRPEVIITTFGDMIRVPSSRSSLEREKAQGAAVRIVYSPIDSLAIAKENPDKKVVFIGVGFETTSPTIAATVLEAERQKLDNFFVLALFKIIPPALKLILSFKERKIDGFILPGHVSAVIGSKVYDFIPREYQIPCVIAGFEPLEILRAIAQLLRNDWNSGVVNQYKTSVRPEGNPKALELLYQVFEVGSAKWRGIGEIPLSGLKFRPEYLQYDALREFKIKAKSVPEPKSCLCGKVLLGLNTPQDCKLFSKTCNPSNPIGPCMVSSEGTCAAYYKYGNRK